jgi:4-amino-4-deoxy-L-arabinose transferase-like glycosyltransferase
MKTLKSCSPYFLLLLPLIYFAIFLHLGSLPFRVWDEAYLSLHTAMMMQDHDYIVTHNLWGSEMSNTKPPLAIWCW